MSLSDVKEVNNELAYATYITCSIYIVKKALLFDWYTMLCMLYCLSHYSQTAGPSKKDPSCHILRDTVSLY